jgi:archaellum component FlaC
MEKLTKKDVEYMSERFYDFYDEIWRIIKEMKGIENEVNGTSESVNEISLNDYCIARQEYYCCLFSCPIR